MVYTGRFPTLPPSRHNGFVSKQLVFLFAILIGAALGMPARLEAGIFRQSVPDKELPPVVPRPDYTRNRPELPELILKEKAEGRYVTGLPLIGWDPDAGFKFGGIFNLFDNGPKEDPYFRISEYSQLFSVLALGSTGGVVKVLAAYDQPYIFDSPWRIRGALYFGRDPGANYFGIGNDSLNLTFPGSAQSFSKYDDYRNALDQESGGFTFARYDQFKSRRIELLGSAEYDLVGGLLRPLIGFKVSRVSVGDFTGETVNAINAAGQKVRAIQRNTHLQDDCLAGRVVGCGGGWDNYLKLGIVFDTRNFAPDPSLGLMTELTSELSHKLLGSSFNYGRLTASGRAFWKLFDWRKQQAVLAGRLIYSWQFGDIPFYSMNQLALTDGDVEGLGGFSTLRGFHENRFIGPSSVLANIELRWSFIDFTILHQHIKLMVTPFLDTGRVFEDVGETSFGGWKTGGGAGLRVAWNLATIMSLDFGVSSEGTTLFMELGHQF